MMLLSVLWPVLLSCQESKPTTDSDPTEEIDPNLDSDGDGYSDADEAIEGTDPNDAESVIYQGGWPYNSEKSSMPDPGWEGPPEIGTIAPNFIAVDQHGDMVNLYDFAGRGKRIVLDVGTPWCSPCKSLAEFLSTNDMSPLIWNEEGEYYPWWKAEYADLYRMIQEEEIYWITILFSEDQPVDSSDCHEWDSAYPNEHVPILGDSDLAIYTYLNIQSYPAISILDEDLRFIVYSDGGPFEALRTLFPQD